MLGHGWPQWIGVRINGAHKQTFSKFYLLLGCSVKAKNALGSPSCISREVLRGWQASFQILDSSILWSRECHIYYWALHHLWIGRVVVAQLLNCVWLCNPMYCSMPGFPVIHHLLELLKLTSIESVMPTNMLSSVIPFSSCLRSFPTSGSFPWVSFLQQPVKELELQLQHQSFQWIFRVDLL